MRTQNISRLSSEPQKAIGTSLMAFFKSILYRTCRFETENDRKIRIQAMQALLDAEHKGRLGWSCK